ncbi:MAG: hypothetical protein HY668_00250 [Chloroflexi bacterium]|nr:hypothetical protein [Chloroflexota bacterium]
MLKFRSYLVLVILAGALAAGCSYGFVPEGKDKPLPSTPPGPASPSAAWRPTNGLVQSSEGGAVTIGVRWLVERQDSLVFEVSMDTHSVDLDRYDLQELAILRDSQGTEYRPTAWKAPPGGHHRSGQLTFAIPGSLGQARFIELIIKNVAGVGERTLKWELG